MQRKIAESVFPANIAAGEYPGDESAHRAAEALADRFDAPTIIAITDAFSYAQRIGGQIHAVTLREWVDRSGLPVPEDEPGEWRTIGMSFHYETRDAKVAVAKAPKAVLDVPVEDFAAPPTTIEVPDIEADVRDEIEAEADALAAEDEPVAAE